MPRNIKRRRRKITPIGDISLTPLIDTALTLLIIFMITAPMMQNSIKVQLPKGKAKEADTVNKELRVVIDKNSKISLNNIPMDIAQLENTVKNIVTPLASNSKSGSDRSVFVEAHKDVAYGNVIKVIDKLKDVKGVDNVVFVMDTLG
ncbi:ExbD/TolR family protein [Candidatus Dependentiae bacterium]